MNGAAVGHLEEDGKWQLRDGVPSSAYRIIHKRLRELRLWTLVTVKQDSYDEVDPKAKAELDRNDPWAVKFMLQYITENFLVRPPTEKSGIESNVTESLKPSLSSFRFEDLPRELRLNVYGCMIPIRQEYSEHCRTGMIRRPRIINVASEVSPEFEEEALKLYYCANTFEVQAPMCCGPEDLQEWVDMVGMKHLGHLRDLKVTFSYYKGLFDNFHVTFSPASGLRAEAQEVDDYNYNPFEPTGGEIIAEIEQRKKYEGLESTGVIDFFTVDPDAVRRCLYGPLVWEQVPDDEIDERDAYQVAYGRVECVGGGCPW